MQFALLLLLAAALAGDPESLGKRIYQQGILPDGRPLSGRIEGDLNARGDMVSCVRCHRRSGMGSNEGAVRVPPITAEALCKPTDLRRADIFGPLFQQGQPIRFRAHLWQLAGRPAYTDQILVRSLRQGIDPAGRELNPAMPRYTLNDQDVAPLVAYLKSLSHANPSGVTADSIHFATVFDENVNPQERQAMLAVMNAYVQRRNRKTRNEREEARVRAVLAGELALPSRQWLLHVWVLKGPAATWGEQLDALHRKQPVVAILGGIISEEWETVGRFCDRTETPCLFPETLLPGTSGPDSYSVYFTGGLEAEAAVLARYLTANSVPRRITQVYRQTDFGNVPASIFQARVQKAGVQVHNVSVPPKQRLTLEFWKDLVDRDSFSELVLWLKDEDLMSLPSTVGKTPRVFLSFRLLKHPWAIPLPRSNLYFVYPFSSPRGEAPEAAHMRAKLLADQISVQDPRIQFDTYFMLSLIDHSLESMAGRISGDYLLETVERETETAPNPGVFPRLSLGPGQRVASKGDRIVRFGGNGELESVSDWIVP